MSRPREFPHRASPSEARWFVSLIAVLALAAVMVVDRSPLTPTTPRQTLSGEQLLARWALRYAR